MTDRSSDTRDGSGWHSNRRFLLLECAVLAALALLALGDGWRIVRTETDTVGSVESGGWLILVAGLLLILVLSHGFSQWRIGDKRPVSLGDNLGSVALATALLFAYIALLPLLGYLVTSVAFLLAYILCFGRYRPIYVVMAVLLATWLSDWLWRALDMNLPQGVFLAS